MYVLDKESAMIWRYELGIIMRRRRLLETDSAGL